MAKASDIKKAQREFWKAYGRVTSDTDIRALLDTFSERLVTLADEYEQSAAAVEDAFGHSTTLTDEMNDRAGMLKDWATRVREGMAGTSIVPAVEEVDVNPF